MGMHMHDKKLYGTATVGTKGQIVIPADAREDLGIKPGDRLYIMNAMQGSGIVCLKEEMLESMVQQLTTHLEDFKAIQKQENNKE